MVQCSRLLTAAPVRTRLRRNDALLAMRRLVAPGFQPAGADRTGGGDPAPRLTELRDDAEVGVAGVDGSGRIVLWNPAVARLTATPAKEALGKRDSEVLPLFTPQGQRTDIRDAPEGPQVLERPDRRRRYLRTSSFTGRGLLGRYAFAVLVDESNERELIQLESLLVANVVHELTTPLTVAIGHAQLLAEQSTASNQIRTSTYEILGALNLASSLVNEVTEAITALATEPPGDCAPADLADSVRAAIGRVPALRDRIELRIGTGTLMKADPDRVTDCLTRLLEEVARYSPPRSPVGVDIARSGAWVRAVVSCAGTLPDRTALESVAAMPGFGLGLFTARAWAQLMRGGLDISNGPADELVLTFRVPHATAHH